MKFGLYLPKLRPKVTGGSLIMPHRVVLAVYWIVIRAGVESTAALPSTFRW